MTVEVPDGAPVDLEPVLRQITDHVIPSMHLGPGMADRVRTPGEATVELYGVADAVCSLWMLGLLDTGPAAAAEWAAALDAFQDPVTGHYLERGPATHVEFHRTAYAVAALELFDRRPRHRIAALDPLATPAAITELIESRDWRDWVYLESHTLAGVGSLVAILGHPGADDDWWAAYFAGLDAHLDPRSGLHGDGKPPAGDVDQIGGTFHHAFVYESRGRPLAHPGPRVDAVLGLQRPDGLWDEDNPLWLTLDAVHLMTRAVDRTGHRRDEVAAAVVRAVQATLGLVEVSGGDRWLVDDPMASHLLVAQLALWAEAQRFLGPGRIRSDRPLRVLLDRRPFI